jgi:hypothetical protein
VFTTLGGGSPRQELVTYKKKKIRAAAPRKIKKYFQKFFKKFSKKILQKNSPKKSQFPNQTQ